MARRRAFTGIPTSQIGVPRDVGADLARQTGGMERGLALQGQPPDVGGALARQDMAFSEPSGGGYDTSPYKEYTPTQTESYSPTNYQRGGNVVPPAAMVGGLTPPMRAPSMRTVAAGVPGTGRRSAMNLPVNQLPRVQRARVGYADGGYVYGSTAPKWDFGFDQPDYGIQASTQPRVGREQELMAAYGMGYQAGGPVSSGAAGPVYTHLQPPGPVPDNSDIDIYADPERYGGRAPPGPPGKGGAYSAQRGRYGPGYSSSYQAGGAVDDDRRARAMANVRTGPIRETNLITGETTPIRIPRIDMRSGIDPDWWEQNRPREGSPEWMQKYGSREPTGYQEGGTVDEGYRRRLLDRQGAWGAFNRGMSLADVQGMQSYLNYQDYLERGGNPLGTDPAHGGSPMPMRGVVGYQAGGTVDDQPQGMNTGYGAPQPQEDWAPRPLREVMDYIWSHVRPSEARADEARQPTPDESRMTGYGGGYGGELTLSPAAPRNLREAQGDVVRPDLGVNVPAREPMSLRSTAPPSISGQDTPMVPETPGASRLGQLGPRDTGYDPNASTLGNIARLPVEWYDRMRRQEAERRAYEGPSIYTGLSDILGTPGRLWDRFGRTVQDVLRGDRPMTDDQFHQRMHDTIQADPRQSHEDLVQQKYNALGREENGLDKQATFVQSMRPYYNQYMGIAQTAMANNRWDQALFAFQRAQEFVPNHERISFAMDPQGGGILATVQPHSGGKGDPYTVRLDQGQLFDLMNGHASHFDNAANGEIGNALHHYAGERKQADGTWAVPQAQPVNIPSTSPTGVGGQSSAAAQRPPTGLVRDERTGETRYPTKEELRARDPFYQQIRKDVADISAAQPRLGGPTPEDIQRIITGTEGPARKAADISKQYEPTDQRSKAAREAFVRATTATPEDIARRKATGTSGTPSAVIPTLSEEGTLTGGYAPAAPGTTITTPEMKARQANLEAQYLSERQKVVEDYTDLQRKARETPNAPYLLGGRAPTSIVDTATQVHRDPKTGVVTGEAQTPHRTVIPGEPTHLVQDAAGAAAEQRRAMTAQQALAAYGPAPWERPGWHTDASQPLPPSVYARGPIQTGAGAPPTAIQKKDVDMLMRNPNMANRYDTIYGPGAARRILGNQTPANLPPVQVQPTAAASAQTQRGTSAQNPVQIRTQDDVARLPRGTWFVGVDGIPRMKNT